MSGTVASEFDPQVGAVANNQWCRGDGTAIQCDQQRQAQGPIMIPAGSQTTVRPPISRHSLTILVFSHPDAICNSLQRMGAPTTVYPVGCVATAASYINPQLNPTSFAMSTTTLVLYLERHASMGLLGRIRI